MSNLIEQISKTDTINSAWQRVSENHGCRGSDGVTIDRFGLSLEQNLSSLSQSIRSGNYYPYPLLRFPIPKRKAKGSRFLSVPTVRDRVAQAAAFLATKDIFEAEFEDVSHAYREGRGVLTAVAEIKKWRDKGYRYVLDADIEAYFDNVPHDLLLQKLGKLLPDPPALHLFEKWIKVEVYDGMRIWKLDKGIPQGSVVSPVLANLFLDELDETLMSLDKKLVRYADDFVILSKSEAEAQENVELTDMILEDLKLDLNPLKTKIESFDKGFKFLGAIFLYNDVYLPFPEKRPEQQPLKLPPPLSLMRYLELRNK